jgi:hypothetical protein
LLTRIRHGSVEARLALSHYAAPTLPLHAVRLARAHPLKHAAQLRPGARPAARHGYTIFTATMAPTPRPPSPRDPVPHRALRARLCHRPCRRVLRPLLPTSNPYGPTPSPRPSSVYSVPCTYTPQDRETIAMFASLRSRSDRQPCDSSRLLNRTLHLGSPTARDHPPAVSQPFSAHSWP